jgi:hypothetical protein
MAERHRFATQITKSGCRGRRSLQAFSSGVCPRFASTETDEESPFHTFFRRRSRTKLAIGELAQVCLDGSTPSICYANTAKLGRAVEGAFPVAVPEKICGLALSLIFSTAAMFAKGKLAVLGVAEDKPHP